jgi:hypothetical protein
LPKIDREGFPDELGRSCPKASHLARNNAYHPLTESRGRASNPIEDRAIFAIDLVVYQDQRRGLELERALDHLDGIFGLGAF